MKGHRWVLQDFGTYEKFVRVGQAYSNKASIYRRPGQSNVYLGGTFRYYIRTPKQSPGKIGAPDEQWLERLEAKDKLARALAEALVLGITIEEAKS